MSTKMSPRRAARKHAAAIDRSLRRAERAAAKRLANQQRNARDYWSDGGATA